MALRLLGFAVVLISASSGFATRTAESYGGRRALLATPPPDLSDKSASDLSKLGLAAVEATRDALKNNTSKDFWYPSSQITLPSGQVVNPSQTDLPQQPDKIKFVDVTTTIPKQGVMVVRLNATYDGATELDKIPGLMIYVWDSEKALWRPLAAAAFGSIKEDICGLLRSQAPDNLTKNVTLGLSATAANGAAAVKTLDSFYADIASGDRYRLYNPQIQVQYPDGSGFTGKPTNDPPPTNGSSYLHPYVTTLNNGDILVVSAWATHNGFVRFDGVPMNGTLSPRLFVLQKDTTNDVGYSIDAIGVYQNRDTYQPELCGVPLNKPPTSDNNVTITAPSPNNKPTSSASGFAVSMSTALLSGVAGITYAACTVF